MSQMHCYMYEVEMRARRRQAVAQARLLRQDKPERGPDRSAATGVQSASRRGSLMALLRRLLVTADPSCSGTTY